MKFIDNFSNCDTNICKTVFRQTKVPIFQNKVYPTVGMALQAPTGDVELVQSAQSGFVFNRTFEPDLMNYDIHYQNEQSNSAFFQDHLKHVMDLLVSFGIKDKKVVEVGCGKGIFFEKMLLEGIDCWGFDPTYEGNNPRIVKDYFSDKYNTIEADVILMRHTLEHIPNPFSFMHTIARANNFKGMLFVEVPTFDWIVEKNAFWDIFYEHCNYFTEQTLTSMYDDAQSGKLFGGQYIYLWADLSKLRNSIPAQEFTSQEDITFNKKLAYYQQFLEEHPSLAIWGAGAKGSTFLNLLDPDQKYVKYVIDINPAKQNKFVAGTAHKICSPDILNTEKVNDILVMNENYFDEIEKTISNFNIQLHNL